jgi:hypothetical protein
MDDELALRVADSANPDFMRGYETAVRKYQSLLENERAVVRGERGQRLTAERDRDRARTEIDRLAAKNPDSVRRAGVRFAQQAAEAEARATAAEAEVARLAAIVRENTA